MTLLLFLAFLRHLHRNFCNDGAVLFAGTHTIMTIMVYVL